MTSAKGNRSHACHKRNAAHQITGIQDQLGNTIAYAVDAMGNRTSQAITDPENGLTQRSYTALDQITTSWSYDVHGRVVKKSTTVGSTTLVTSYSHDGTGDLVAMTLPSGAQVAYTWTNG